MCQWILDFLLHRPQTVKIGNTTSKSLVLNSGAPQGCVLSPKIYSLYTSDCVSHVDSVKLIKFADDTTVEGLISGEDERTCRKEVEVLETWCLQNNLDLNVQKTKELVVDFRKNKSPVVPLMIGGQEVEMVDTFKFLGTTISSSLTWEDNTSAVVKKAHQRMYFLRRLRRFGVSQKLLVSFYRAVIESVLTFSVTVWYKGLTQEEKNRLDRVVKTAERIVGCKLPSLGSIYHQRVISRSQKIIADPSHPARNLYCLLPSGRRYRCLRTRTTRFLNSFFPQAMQIMSKL